jgi:hypothetical protein
MDHRYDNMTTRDRESHDNGDSLLPPGRIYYCVRSAYHQPMDNKIKGPWVRLRKQVPKERHPCAMSGSRCALDRIWKHASSDDPSFC